MIIEVCICSQSALISWCAIIYCNYKAQNNRRFQLSKDTSVRKDWIHAIGCQVDNLPSKSSYVQTILKKIALIPGRNFKMNCIIKTAKWVEGFSLDQYQLDYLLRNNKPRTSSEKRAMTLRLF